MEKTSEENYIKQQIGLLSSGGSTIDTYVKHHTHGFYIFRDLKIKSLLMKEYNNVCIIGSFPLPLALAFKSNVTILDDTKVLEHYKDEFKQLYNIDVVIKDPMFADIQSDIEDKDLIIYHDSEFQVPLEYYQHKHKDIDVLIMNTYFYSAHKHSKNFSYTAEELLELYPMKDVYKFGRVYFVNDYFTCYSYGVIDD